jgi:hypothetical protein
MCCAAIRSAVIDKYAGYQRLERKRSALALLNPHEPPQPRSHHRNHFQRHIGMLAAKVLKILARDEQKLRKRTSRPFDRQHLFPAGSGQLVNPNLPRRYKE